MTITIINTRTKANFSYHPLSSPTIDGTRWLELANRTTMYTSFKTSYLFEVEVGKVATDIYSFGYFFKNFIHPTIMVQYDIMIPEVVNKIAARRKNSRMGI